MIARGVMGRGERVLSQQEKLNCRVCAWPVITVVAIIAFACIAIFSDWPWGESPWTAGAALATFMAALSALHISRREEKRRSEREKKKAAIVAAQAIVVLDRFQRSALSQLLARGLQSFGKTKEEGVRTFPTAGEHLVHQNLLQGLIEGMHGDMLADMLVIRDGFSGRAAALVAQSQLLLRDLGGLHLLLSLPLDDFPGARKQIDEYWASLERLRMDVWNLIGVAQHFFAEETGSKLSVAAE